MANDKIIIYDDSCPLCCWYTDAFVSTGLLKKENRLSFGQLSGKGLLEKLDFERSKDEIPLLDSADGATLYGIDSLLEILGKRWPWVKRVAKIKPINWFLRRLYKLVSYNRRVIVASPPTPNTDFDCTPHFNVFYRLLYILLALTVGVSSITMYLLLYFPSALTWCIGAIITLLMLRGLNWSMEKRIDYWGIMATPFLLAGILLLPTLLWPALKLIIGLLIALLTTRMLWRRSRLISSLGW